MFLSFLSFWLISLSVSCSPSAIFRAAKILSWSFSSVCSLRSVFPLLGFFASGEVLDSSDEEVLFLLLSNVFLRNAAFLPKSCLGSRRQLTCVAHAPACKVGLVV